MQQPQNAREWLTTIVTYMNGYLPATGFPFGEQNKIVNWAIILVIAAVVGMLIAGVVSMASIHPTRSPGSRRWRQGSYTLVGVAVLMIMCALTHKNLPM